MGEGRGGARLGRMGAGTFVSVSTEGTIELGRLLGTLLADGDVLVLTGDLGAGKTQLTKGIACGLGVGGDVTSPTFTIEMVYDDGRVPLYHFDLYRLQDPSELEELRQRDLVFEPEMDEARADALVAGWRKAVERTLL